MALSKTQKIGIINKWIAADAASLFQAVSGLCDENGATAAEEFYLQTESGCYFCEDFDTLWDVVLRENNEEVKILRKKGTDDEEITAKGYTLPEDLARLEQLEHVTIIQRTYTGGGIYIYRGRLADGRYFFGATDEEPEILKDGINPFGMDWDDLCYGVRDEDMPPLSDGSYLPIYKGETTTATVDELWDNSPEMIKSEE